MNLNLENRVAILAAATDGLGLAAAKQLLSEGAKVAVCGRDEKRNAQAHLALSQLSNENNFLVFSCDVTDKIEIEKFVAAAVEKFSQLDVLITNAGGPPTGTFETIALEMYDKAFQLTMMSVVHFVKAALPYLKKSETPSILTITSTAAKEPIPNLFMSNVIRPAVIGLTKTLSQELGVYGIRVNSILPGWTATDRSIYLLNNRAEKLNSTYEECEKAVVKNIPLKRMGLPQEFANVAAFLVSPAASYVNGVMMQVDGGAYMGLM